ncbi:MULTISPECIES: DUF1850 domain-containing protein [Halomonas]|uniref:DUF1850 domain-containing protein n=1 Tax=Halomonas halophila TaxID=29573 RepID=A0ABQ0U0V3_9GAMM|nr:MULTISPECIES: DUF1850 domain-containing protein [Halomonas]MDR5888681.1 DUF1850 domain-containing protein [Halomonas salina]WJY07861.1 DUF1850 domain-containing protein [Halomonas halophila]GEK71957.1 hypothetical protein HHA04nite_05010 [Halomonas halophila]
MTPGRAVRLAPSSWRVWVNALLAALLLGGLAPPALADCPSHELTVRDAEHRPLVRLPMPEGEGWCLAWNHSVEGFTVHDCYRNVAGHMVLQRSHLPDFAAGLDHIPGRGRQVSDGRGGYWIEAIDEPVPGDAYRLRVGSPRVDHRLVGRPGGAPLATLLDAARDCDAGGGYPDAAESPVVVSLSELAANERVTLALEAAMPDDEGA